MSPWLPEEETGTAGKAQRGNPYGAKQGNTILRGKGVWGKGAKSDSRKRSTFVIKAGEKIKAMGYQAWARQEI